MPITPSDSLHLYKQDVTLKVRKTLPNNFSYFVKFWCVFIYQHFSLETSHCSPNASGKTKLLYESPTPNECVNKIKHCLKKFTKIKTNLLQCLWNAKCTLYVQPIDMQRFNSNTRWLNLRIGNGGPSRRLI